VALSVRYGIVVCRVMVLLSTTALGHYYTIFADLHLPSFSVLDGVVQAFRNQKRFLVRVPRTVRENCGRKATCSAVAKTCCPWLLYCLV